jgi:hypothetical protein
MKLQSWYEPEKDRIVVLDLESEDEDDDLSKSTGQGQLEPEFVVSSALLSRLPAAHESGLRLPTSREAKECQALVLFKAPAWRPSTPEPEPVPRPKTPTNIVEEDDKMDIE